MESFNSTNPGKLSRTWFVSEFIQVMVAGGSPSAEQETFTLSFSTWMISRGNSDVKIGPSNLVESGGKCSEK